MQLEEIFDYSNLPIGVKWEKADGKLNTVDKIAVPLNTWKEMHYVKRHILTQMHDEGKIQFRIELWRDCFNVLGWEKMSVIELIEYCIENPGFVDELKQLKSFNAVPEQLKSLSC